MNVSGFTFVHNAIENGYPLTEAIWSVIDTVDEMVVVDMESTDGTVTLLERLGVRVLHGEWIPGAGGACLAKAHEMHVECKEPVILHFEADEVFGSSLSRTVAKMIAAGHTSLAVYRLQLEQNFQRCRWYPSEVHRVFPRGTVQKQGHTTKQHWEYLDPPVFVPPEAGYLWDFPSMCRGDWIPRMKVQAELWGHEPKFKLVPYHFNEPVTELTEKEAEEYIRDPIWQWKMTPFRIPRLMEGYLGKERCHVR